MLTVMTAAGTDNQWSPKLEAPLIIFFASVMLEG